MMKRDRVFEQLCTVITKQANKERIFNTQKNHQQLLAFLNFHTLLSYLFNLYFHIDVRRCGNRFIIRSISLQALTDLDQAWRGRSDYHF